MTSTRCASSEAVAELDLDATRLVGGLAADAANVRLGWSGPVEDEAPALDGELEGAQVHRFQLETRARAARRSETVNVPKEPWRLGVAADGDGDIRRNQGDVAQAHVAPQQRQQRGGEGQRSTLPCALPGMVKEAP